MDGGRQELGEEDKTRRVPQTLVGEGLVESLIFFLKKSKTLMLVEYEIQNSRANWAGGLGTRVNCWMHEKKHEMRVSLKLMNVIWLIESIQSNGPQLTHHT